MVYVNRSPFTKCFANQQTSATYIKLMLRTTCHFKVLEVRDHVLAIDKSVIANTIPIDRATPTPVGFHHRHWSLESRSHIRHASNVNKDQQHEFFVQKN